VACHYLYFFQWDVQGIQPVIDHTLPDSQRIDCRFRNKLPPPVPFQVDPLFREVAPLGKRSIPGN
jgi:hypothetical protein